MGKKRRFKTGDRVVLVRKECMNAAIGSKATVSGYDDEYLDIIWDKDIVDNEGKHCAQMDGGYYENMFELISKDWDE